MSVDLEKANREEMRWRILRALDAGRPGRVSETLLLRVVGDASLQVTPNSLRRQLDYLRDKGLVEIEGEGGPTWSGDLTAYGIDVVEGAKPLPPGIYKPAN